MYKRLLYNPDLASLNCPSADLCILQCFVRKVTSSYSVLFLAGQMDQNTSAAPRRTIVASFCDEDVAKNNGQKDQK